MRSQNKQQSLIIQMKQNQNDQAEDINIQNSIFNYKKYPNTFFVPVYPRAHVEQIIGIDYDRRTVTARFVIHITINLKVNIPELKQYIRNHLVLQFGYNQIIYIPEVMIRDNPQYIINEVLSACNNEDYITYKIKGNLQCAANFDLMLFPYRQIEVVNHLVIRSQVYRQYNIKYNAMLLLNKTEPNINQFSPYIYFPQFAGFRIINFSTQAITEQSKYSVKQNIHPQTLINYLVNFILNKKPAQEVNLDTEEIFQTIFGNFNDLQLENQQEVLQDQYERLQELSPYKHIVFKFDMMSLKLAFVFQNETPIWVLAVLSLYAFTSPCDISNKYGNIVLLIVSFVALLTNFRLNNVSHPYITFFQLKLILIYSVPIMLIISTVLDYYSNSDPSQTTFTLRTSQIQNPFMLASLIIVIITFFTTVFFLLYVAFTRVIFVEETSKSANKNEAQSAHYNLVDHQWRHPKLFRKITELIKQNKTSFQFEDKNLQGNFTSRISKKYSQIQLPKIKHTDIRKIKTIELLPHHQ